MKLFTRVAFLLLAFVAVIGGQEAKAQLTMTPLDSVYTYNSKATLGTVTNPNQPATGKIGKWIRTVRMSWNTNEYKAYIFNGTDFRIHFPHTYNPTTPNGKRYPIIAFYHGDGEDGTIYDNELTCTCRMVPPTSVTPSSAANLLSIFQSRNKNRNINGRTRNSEVV
jgi:hypothetical protein